MAYSGEKVLVFTDSVDADISYICDAVAGSETTDSTWAIMRMDQSASSAQTLSVTYPTGLTSHIFKVSLRETYIYS